VCILAGAGGELGSCFCRLFAADYDIVAVYRRRRPPVAAPDASFLDPLDPQRPLEDNRLQVFAVKADLTGESECDRVVGLALTRFGRVDLVVNAVVSSTWGPMLGNDRLRRSGAEQMVTNVVVPLNLAASVASQFWEGRDDENRLHRRNVVNVSSVAGLRLYQHLGQSMYAASKAALNHLTLHMAQEFDAIGVRVNAVAPNSFPSLIPTSRVAASIVRLDRGPANGTVVVVDGDEDQVFTMAPYGADVVTGWQV
jgi:NAD(P)-dependent dehydrogenase (short-subunit alcohol dehydrogenase family)